MLIDDDDIPPQPKRRAVYRDGLWRPDLPFDANNRLSWFHIESLAWHLVAANMDVSPQELPKALGRDYRAVQEWVIDRLGLEEALRLHAEEVEKHHAD